MAEVTFEMLARRIAKRMRNLDPKSVRFREALTSVGMLVTNEAKINATRRGIIDTGSLRRAINFELIAGVGKKSGVIISPFGIRYAAMHEFGGPFTKLMRKAMFASLREAGKLNRVPTRKGIIVGNTFRARPYLGPALKTNTDRIIKIFQTAISQSISDP